MLELNGLSKTFGGVKAVSNVSLRIEAKEVRGLIGPNGAGKSTLVNLISGLLKQSEGSLELDGTVLDGLAAPKRAQMGIGRTFQNLRVFPSLTVQQNIEVAQSTTGASGPKHEEFVQSAIAKFNLTDNLNMRAGNLAYGHLRRLEIVRALALKPKIIMLDEPAAGMNEHETKVLAEALRWLRQESDCAMLVIDHDLKFIMALCDNITVLNMGSVIADGKPNEVANNRQVIDAYLGEDHTIAV
jgi:branched-chain amino acid transport system ATP-binding protein|tara:strand:+ start:426 stop:1151 length:726 start_codon:yes stop_codon:yes gene_type:complete